MGVGGQRHAPAALPPGKRPGSQMYRTRGGPQDRSGRVRKISPPPHGLRSPHHPASSEALYRNHFLKHIYSHVSSMNNGTKMSTNEQVTSKIGVSEPTGPDPPLCARKVILSASRSNDSHDDFACLFSFH